MSSNDDPLDDAKHWATIPAPGTTTAGEELRVFDVMSIDELAGAWSAHQYVGLRDHTAATHLADVYFSHLPHEQPERAFALALGVLRSEADKSVKMQLNQNLMTALLHKHGATLVDEIEAAADGNTQLRWLLGGSAWWAGGAIAERLKRVADEEAWSVDDDARSQPREKIDFPALSAAALARTWVEQKAMPYKDTDDNWHALADYIRDLLEHDPDRVIDMIAEVLKVEENKNVLGLLAAGPLEDAIGYNTIDRIEREARASEKFAWLLGGVWYHREPEDIQKRLDAIVQDRAWAN